MKTDNEKTLEGCPICGCCARMLRPGWLLGNDTSMTACKTALLLLRLLIGAIFAYHGLQKAFGWFGGQGFDSAIGAATATGLKPPVFWAVMLVVAEAAGGLALILGVGVRIGAALNAIVMAVALLTVKAGQGFAETHLQQLLLVGCLALLIAGGGGLSLWPARDKPGCATAGQSE